MGKQAFLALLEPDASLADIRQILAERISDMCADDERTGCLFVHTAMEVAPQEPELKDVLLRFMQRMARLFSIGLETAKEKGEIRADVDTRAAGEMLTSTLFGLAVLGRAGFSRDALERIVDSALATLTD
jgi:TetR/AcrR family transcriptional repressor of nem operon